MANRYFRTPEAALKRAKEKVKVGERVQAVNALHNLLTSRRVKTWSQTMEDVMILYIDLCVELKKPRLAKDGLHQYRVVCQQSNIYSMSTVMKHFLESSEKAAEQAQTDAEKSMSKAAEKAKQETFESKLLSSVSGEDAKDRADREHVTPWLKFLWETYKTVLDILRTNQKLEQLYHYTARHAFHFCIKYERKTEFRRLSEILRIHFSNITRYPQQLEALVQSEDSLPLRLQTAFTQLNTAAQLELWQEAFRVIEGIRMILVLSRRAPKPQMMAAYYEKLTQVFWVANNHLYHGFCAYKQFLISLQHNKGMSAEERSRQANKVSLAILSIPMKKEQSKHLEKRFELDVQQEKDLKLAALLGLQVAPTRTFLIRELKNRRIIEDAEPETRLMYELLENKFQPLELCENIKVPLDKIRVDETNQRYLAPLERLITAKVLKQLETVYENMRLADLKKMTSFVTESSPEKLIIQSVRNHYVNARIDHLKGVVHFGSQSLESDNLRDHLSHFALAVHDATKLLATKDQVSEEKKAKEATYKKLAGRVEEERKSLLARRQIIEKKKEMLEIREKHRIEREELLRVEKAKAQREKEIAHIKQLEENRAAEAKEQQRKAMLEQQKVTIVESIKKNKSLEQDVVEQLTKKIDEDSIDPRSLLGAQVRIMNERQAELRGKMDKLAIRLDHIERSRRLAEKPKLEASIEEENESYQNSMSEYRNEQLTKHRELWNAAKAEKERLSKVLAVRSDFESRLLAKRQKAYETAKAEQDTRLAPKREEIKAKREAEAAKIEADRKAQIEALRKKAKEEKEKSTSTGIDFVPPPSRFAASKKPAVSSGNRWGDTQSPDPSEKEPYRPSAARPRDDRQQDSGADRREPYRPGGGDRNRDSGSGFMRREESRDRDFSRDRDSRDSRDSRDRDFSRDRDRDDDRDRERETRSWSRQPSSGGSSGGSGVYRPGDRNRDRDRDRDSGGGSGVYRPPRREGSDRDRDYRRQGSSSGGGGGWGSRDNRDRDRDRDRDSGGGGVYRPGDRSRSQDRGGEKKDVYRPPSKGGWQTVKK